MLCWRICLRGTPRSVPVPSQKIARCGSNGGNYVRFCARCVLWLITGCIFFVTGCGSTSTKPAKSGVVLQNFDRSVRPQDDFYRFVNGSWLKRTTIPADRSNYGMFTILADTAKKDVRAIIDETAEAAESATDGSSDAYKIGTLFNSAMDTKTLTERGTAPLSP